MGENRTGGGTDFWRAGEEPVRPVRAIKNKDEDEKGTKEVKKTTTKEKKVRVSMEEAEKGEKALSREDKRQYHDAVTEERRMEEDGDYVLEAWVKTGQEEESTFGGQVRSP